MSELGSVLQFGTERNINDINDDISYLGLKIVGSGQWTVRQAACQCHLSSVSWQLLFDKLRENGRLATTVVL